MTTFGLICAIAYLVWAWNNGLKKKQKMRDALDTWNDTNNSNSVETDKELQEFYDKNLQKGKYDKSI